MPAVAAAEKRPKHNRRRRDEPDPAALLPSKDEALTLLAVVAIAAAVAVACSYLSGALNRRPRPFCDSGDGVSEAVSEYEDLCDPCPDNGLCYDGKLECFHGYKKHGRVCVEDGEIDQMASKLSERTKQHMCDSYARVLCDQTGKIWFQESEISEFLDEVKLNENIGLKDDAYSLAKHKLLETIESFMETKAVLNGLKEFKCPELLAELHRPLRCCIRQWVYRHCLLIITLFSLLVGFSRFILILRSKHLLSKRVEQLYTEVCEILEDNALMAKNSNEGDPWVVTSWLRDHLLLPRERKDTKLWKKVEELILEDSRIDQYPKLIKGESKIVLEWQVDGPLSLKMRSKGSSSNRNIRRTTGTPSMQERKPKVSELQLA